MAIKFYDKFHPDYEDLYEETDPEEPTEEFAEIKFTNRSGNLLYVYEYDEGTDSETVALVVPPNIRTSWHHGTSNDIVRVVSSDGEIDFKFSGYGGVIVPGSGIPYEYAYSVDEKGWSVDYGWGIPDLVELLDIDLVNAEPEKLPLSDFNNNEELNLFNALEAWKAGYDGSGIKIAVIDNGIIDHPEISVIGERDLIDDDNDTTPPDDDTLRTHGLKVASVIAAKNDLDEVDAEQPDITGIAPKAEIIDVKVLANGEGEISDVAAGIRYAVDQGARIVQLSLGVRSLARDEDMDQAVKYAVDHNVLLVFAAGNTGISEPIGLALFAYEHPIIIVGNLHSSTLLPAVTSALAGTIEYDYFSAPSGGYYPGESEDYDLVPPGLGGTSYSSPYLSGIAALLIQKYPEISLEELVDKLRDSSEVPGFHFEKPDAMINSITWDGAISVEGTSSVDIVFFDVASTEISEVPNFSDTSARIEIKWNEGIRAVDIGHNVEKIVFNDNLAASPRSSLTMDDSLELVFAYGGENSLNDQDAIGQVVSIVESTGKADLLDYINALLFPDAEDFMPSILLAISNVYGIEGDTVEDLVEDFMFATGKSQEELFWYIAESETADEMINLVGLSGDLIFYSVDSALFA